MRYPYLFAALLALPLAGCYQEYQPEVDIQPVLCINSIITAGEPVEVEVSRTWLYSDVAGERNHSVPDACVTITANGLPVGEDYIPVEGDQIHILATSQRFGQAEASVTVPRSAQVDTLTVTPRFTDVWYQNDYDYWIIDADFDMSVILTLTDIDKGDNFYHYDCNSYRELSSTETMQWYLSPGTLLYKAVPVFSDHIGLLESVGGADADGFTFFTDRSFANESYTLRLYYHNARIRITVPVDSAAEAIQCGFNFDLNSISPSYYNWVNYVWQTTMGYIGDLGNVGLGEPAPGYSNVSTGAGVVAARAVNRHSISLAPFLQALADSLDALPPSSDLYMER